MRWTQDKTDVSPCHTRGETPLYLGSRSFYPRRYESLVVPAVGRRDAAFGRVGGLGVGSTPSPLAMHPDPMTDGEKRREAQGWAGQGRAGYRPRTLQDTVLTHPDSSRGDPRKGGTDWAAGHKGRQVCSLTGDIFLWLVWNCSASSPVPPAHGEM